MAELLRFVDAHHHLQDIKSHYYPWLSDQNTSPQLEGDLTPIRRNYLLLDYFKDMSTINLVKSVHVQNGWDPRDPVGETRWLQQLADKHGFPHGMVAYADLASAGVEKLLEAHSTFANVRGIRQILNWHTNPIYRVAARDGLMDDASWRRGFALLSRYKMSFDLQIYWPQMEDAYCLAKAYPETQIILNHFGMPIDRSPDGIKTWSSALANLAQAPNVAIKLSGFGLGHPKWTFENTSPLLVQAIEIFGPQRVMFGTNLPVDRLFAEPQKILVPFAKTIEQYSPAERDAMSSLNAERIYRI